MWERDRPRVNRRREGDRERVRECESELESEEQSGQGLSAPRDPSIFGFRTCLSGQVTAGGYTHYGWAMLNT